MERGLTDEDYGPEEKCFLMLLYAPNKRGKLMAAVMGNVILQKEMFLLTKNLAELKDLTFEEHRLGPHSPALESLQTQFMNSRIIRQYYNQGPISLTEKGGEIAKKIWDHALPAIKNKITDIKHFLNDLQFEELIALIYSSYPETTENSDAVKKYEQTRAESAVSLFRKKKISLEKGAEVAGKPIEDFVKLLQRNNITPFEIDRGRFKKDLDLIERLIRR